MRDQLERDLRRLILKFEADVRHIVRVALLAALDATPNFDPAMSPAVDLDAGASAAGATRGPDEIADPPRRTLPRSPLTAEEIAAVRIRIAAVLRQQPGQGTRDLASILGIPSAQLRSQLRQLASEGVISVEEHNLGGVKRHTYRAVERHPGHHAESLAVGAAA
jgi:hypothetical protein